MEIKLIKIVDEIIYCGWGCINKNNNTFIDDAIDSADLDLNNKEYLEAKHIIEKHLLDGYSNFEHEENLYFYDDGEYTEEGLKEELGINKKDGGDLNA